VTVPVCLAGCRKVLPFSTGFLYFPAGPTVSLLTVSESQVSGVECVSAGARAIDKQDKDISNKIISNGAGLVDTSAPTLPSSPWIISYDVQDLSGNRAKTMYRRVLVQCIAPETICTDSDTPHCSLHGVCGLEEVYSGNTFHRTTLFLGFAVFCTNELNDFDINKHSVLGS
jgi:hypothetical protein